MERELVERARRGDRSAFESLARDDGPRLFLVCHRILRNVEGAEDALQQTLIRVWRELPSLRDPARFEAWSYRIAVNCCYHELRRDRRIRTDVRLLSDAEVGSPNPYDRLADHDAIERAFCRLSPEHRAVVVLRYFVGLSLQQIADAIGAPPGTVASRLHYALADLRRELAPAGLDVVSREGVPA